MAVAPATALRSMAESGAAPDVSKLKSLVAQAAQDPASFFTVDVGTLQAALGVLVSHCLNREDSGSKQRIAALTLIANLSKETAYASVLMQAVQQLEEGFEKVLAEKEAGRAEFGMFVG
ncbi:unnamed protein product, partial [Symbiodinium sp. KB8]